MTVTADSILLIITSSVVLICSETTVLPRQEILNDYRVTDTDWVATAFEHLGAERGGDLRQARLMFLGK